MATNNKTSLGFNDWLGTDKPERQDFANDNKLNNTLLSSLVVQPTFVPVTLTNGTTNSYPTNEGLIFSYTKYGRIVQLYGVVNFPTDNYVGAIAQFASNSGLIPLRKMVFEIISNGSYEKTGRCEVNASGNIVVAMTGARNANLIQGFYFV